MEPKGEQVWIEQFDPIAGQKYYYNAETRETSYDRPASVSNELDTILLSVLRIQCAYRSKRARDAVKQKHSEDQERIKQR